ncbi:MAG: aspartate kinase, partial [Deltaproteobacteria bacterium]|nr:aspartate kinase [Deltaproteobacteria bacterium]
MNIIVQKYGGTSVADIDRIKSVASRIASRVKGGESIAVVLSAMAGETNELLKMASGVSENPNPRDMDLLLSTGEQMSIAILAMTLKEIGIDCETFLGHQAGVITDDKHGRARIKRMDVTSVQEALDQGMVAIVAGFQGVSESGEITTIGRGGSDTSAVALAAALNAERCEIFTDVDGIYTADPNICSSAKLLDRTSYEEMMELADAGAKVLHTRAVELAAKYRVPLEVRSSFGNKKGTMVVPEDEISEGTIVTGITCNIDEA